MSTIILFGFAGSGKSTLANDVALHYNLRVIHPSGIMRDLYEGKPLNLNHTRYNKGFWEEPEGIAILKKRLQEDQPIDVRVNTILVEEAEKGNVVIDSWSLPWLTNISIKIYLKADLSTRAQRVANRSNFSYDRAKSIVAQKDQDTRTLFSRLYGFDIQKDETVFDHIIQTDTLTKEQVFSRIVEYVDIHYQGT